MAEKQTEFCDLKNCLKGQLTILSSQRGTLIFSYYVGLALTSTVYPLLPKNSKKKKSGIQKRRNLAYPQNNTIQHLNSKRPYMTTLVFIPPK